MRAKMNIYSFLAILWVCGCVSNHKKNNANSAMKDYLSVFENAKDDWPEHFSYKKFCTLVERNNIKGASQYVNVVLMGEPDNKNLHLLNGLLYEERARLGEMGCSELASVAYNRARGSKSDYSWMALYFSGMRCFRDAKYHDAQKQLAKAFALHPDQCNIALALACASYCVGDMPVALLAIDRALKQGDDNIDVLNAASLIFSASNQKQRATEVLNRLRQCSPQGHDVTCRGVNRWQQFHVRKASAESADDESSQNDTEDQGTDKEKEGKKDQPPLVVMDCILLSHDEDNRTSKGNNILENMALTLGGSNPVSFASQSTQTGSGIRPGLNQTSSAWSKTFDFSLTLPSVTYSLNILNALKTTTSVMTRPTITAVVGNEGYFHQGTQFLGATNGSLTGSSLASFDAGIVMQATPTKIENGYITIELTVEGSYFPVSPNSGSGITDQVVRLERSKVSSTVRVKLGKTAMVGSVHLKARRDNRAGVPGLSSIPFVQYLFAKDETSDLVRSVVVLITPRLAKGEISDAQCRPHIAVSAAHRHLLSKGFGFAGQDSSFCLLRQAFKRKAYLFSSKELFFGATNISLKKNLWMLKSLLWY
jgi:tetratricopeptide (TPR) repeat protein